LSLVNAMIARRWCEPAELEYAQVPEPRPAAGDVLIDTRAIGVNFPDILMVQGKYQIKPALPFSPGHEVGGVVAEVGAGVGRVAPGQRVLALLGWGGYAERVTAAAAGVFAIPDAMGFEAAAAFGLVYQTAYCALVQRAALRPGEWLLVHGAAGGVGLAAVQLGKALGARVIATAGTDAKLEIARQSGADALINYRTEEWVERVKALTGGEGADVIYDPVGGDVFDLSTKCIAFEGRLLTIGFAGGRIPSVAVNRVLIKNFSVVGVHWGLYQRRGSELIDGWMDTLFALFGKRQVWPVVYRTYPLRDAAVAMRALAERESYGKVVLIP
jgi:NADPH2:quinone reductase